MNMLQRYGIREDPRFSRARREALAAAALVLADTLWVFGFAFWGTTSGGIHASPIAGVPAWMFWAALGGLVLYPAAGIVIALRIKSCSLGETSDEEGS